MQSDLKIDDGRKQPTTQVHAMKINILMIGPALTQNGGMATLEKLILKHAPSPFNLRLIVAHDEGSIPYRLWVFSRCLLSFLGALVFQQVDVVYIHVSDKGSLLRKAIVASLAFLFRKPVVMHTHGGGFPETHKRLPRLARTLLNKVFCKCNAVIVLSESWKEFYAMDCGIRTERIHALINAVEIPEKTIERAERQTETTNILCCSRIRHLKGSFDLIQAFSMLPERLRCKCDLIMAGDGEVEEAKRLAIKHGIHDRVQFMGWVDETQREQLIEQADIFTLPSYFEGLPMAILEAMAAGLPIQSTRVGGIPEIVTDGQNGLLVDAGNIDLLKKSLQTLIENRPMRLQLGRQARVDCKAHDIAVYWETLADIFLPLVRKKKNMPSKRAPIE
jgi:glycosyltransferase involved in cell wall biosynthesis